MSTTWNDGSVLSRLLIENFRKFDRYSVEFGRRNLVVGPNNAGKSTVIEALRLVSIAVNRAGNLTIEHPPDWLTGRHAAHGAFPSLRGLDFDLGKETFHQYADPPATITAEFDSGNQVVVHIGPGGEIFATTRDSDGSAIQSKRHARQLDPERIGIQPQVGPIARFERPLADRYVRGALDSSLAPNHFRNQLRLLDEYFEEFKSGSERSWSGLVIDGLEARGLGDERHLALYLRDGAFVGELASMGHGLQMWLQLMWFLARATGDNTIVLDEPDVYMHPDLQRRLIRFLFKRNQQVIVATHSVEMMSEVDPDELVPIDASQRKARPARKVADIQRVVDQIGGVHNIEFARLARASSCLVMPSSATRLLSRWYDLVASDDKGALDLLPAFPCDGWHEWPYVVASKRAIDRLRDDPIHMICLMPGGLPRGLFEGKLQEAGTEGIDLRIWPRQDLHSYLLDPFVISRMLGGEEQAAPASVAGQIDAIAEALRGDAKSRALVNASTLGDPYDVERWFNEQWQSPEGRLSVLPARVAILRLSAWVNGTLGRKIGMRDLTSAFEVDDLDPEVAAVTRAIAQSESVAAITEMRSTRPWPDTPVTKASGSNSEQTEDVLDLFEAAGIFD